MIDGLALDAQRDLVQLKGEQHFFAVVANVANVTLTATQRTLPCHVHDELFHQLVHKWQQHACAHLHQVFQ